MAESITIGRRTVIASTASMLQEVAGVELEQQLFWAEKAYASGQRLGLLDAVRLWRRHRRERPFPEWMHEGLDRELAAPCSAPQADRKRGGRLANQDTRRRQRLIDFTLAMAVNKFLAEGLTHNGACEKASQVVRINDEARSKKVFEQSYERFYFRLGAAPEEFYPLIHSNMTLIEIMMATPADGVGAKKFAEGLAARK